MFFFKCEFNQSYFEHFAEQVFHAARIHSKNTFPALYLWVLQVYLSMISKKSRMNHTEFHTKKYYTENFEYSTNGFFMFTEYWFTHLTCSSCDPWTPIDSHHLKIPLLQTLNIICAGVISKFRRIHLYRWEIGFFSGSSPLIWPIFSMESFRMKKRARVWFVNRHKFVRLPIDWLLWKVLILKRRLWRSF